MRRHARQKVSRELKQSDAYNELIENWLSRPLWSSLHAYLTVKPIEASPVNICKKFKVSLHEAVDAVDGLEKLSLLLKDCGYYRAKKLNFIIESENCDKEKHIEFHKFKVRDTLTQVNAENLKHGIHGVFTTSNVLLEQFDRDFKSLLKKFYEESSRVSDADIVCNATSTLVSVSKIEQNKGEE